MNVETEARVIVREILELCGAEDAVEIMNDSAIDYMSRQLLEFWNSGYRDGQADGSAYPWGGKP